MTARLPEYAALLTVVGRLFLPAFLGQATVVFTLLHVFTYLGMYVRVRACARVWGGISNYVWCAPAVCFVRLELITIILPHTHTHTSFT